MQSTEVDDEEGARLISLCEEGQADDVKAILRRHPLLVSFVDRRGRSPLIAAAGGSSLGVVSVLLACGADAAVAGKGGWTAMHVAAQKGNAELIKELLGAGASCSAKNEDGNTPLHYCVRKAIAEEVLAVMLSRCESVNAVNKANETCLFISAWRDNLVAVELLIKCGADVNLANNKKQTPLHAAALSGSARVCAALLKHGANALLADDSGKLACDVSAPSCATLLRAATEQQGRKARVEGWLRQIGVDERYHEAFVREEFDLPSLALITESVLAGMGLPAAVRLTVMHNARLLDGGGQGGGGGMAAARSSLGSSNSNGYHRLDSTTSDLEEEVTGGEEGGLSLRRLREALLARNVPVLEGAELQLRHVIGSGFFSCVRLAEWHGVSVACKTINEQPNRLKNQLEVFLQEVGIMARLRHPNVVQFLGVTLQPGGDSSNTLAILTEYMAGGTLHAAMRESRYACCSGVYVCVF